MALTLLSSPTRLALGHGRQHYCMCSIRVLSQMNGCECCCMCSVPVLPQLSECDHNWMCSITVLPEIYGLGDIGQCIGVWIVPENLYSTTPTVSSFVNRQSSSSHVTILWQWQAVQVVLCPQTLSGNSLRNNPARFDH